VRIIPGFLDDVLEDLPPASEQAAVVLVQIGFEICQILFLASYCDLPVIIPIKPCPVADEGLCSSPVMPSLSLRHPAQETFTTTRCRWNLDP